MRPRYVKLRAVAVCVLLIDASQASYLLRFLPFAADTLEAEEASPFVQNPEFSSTPNEEDTTAGLTSEKTTLEAVVAVEAERAALLDASVQQYAGQPAVRKRTLLQVFEGVACLVAVAVIWVGASVLVQYLYSNDAQLPFFLTYICNSEFIILLPLRYMRERYNCHVGKCKVTKAVETDWKKAAKVGAIVCPLWFLAQGSYNWSLAGTSVSSSTILSTTSCVFTFALSLLFLKEKFKWGKLFGVAITLGGAAMVSFSDTSSNSSNTWWGDALAIFSAAMYGVYTTAIRKFVPDNGKVSMAAFFGFLGLFNSLALWPLVLILQLTKVEDVSAVSGEFIMWIIIKGLFDNVLSDLLWARAIHLTSPTVATIALSLTIPFAMISDLLIHHTTPTALVACGSVAVCIGFVLSTVSLDKLQQSPSASPAAVQDAHSDTANEENEGVTVGMLPSTS